MKFTKTITVSVSDQKTIQEYLDMDSVDLEEEGIDKESVYLQTNVMFDNGYEADIKVCTTEDDFFVDAILFDANGNQMRVLDPEYELLGEYIFDDDEDEYIVNVVIGEEAL